MLWRTVTLMLVAAASVGCDLRRQPSLKIYDSQKLGISIKIPVQWTESQAYRADDNRFGVGEDSDGGTVIVFTRSRGASISKRYPNLPGPAVSLQLIRADAQADRLIKVDEIAIGKAKFYCGVKDIAAQPGIRNLRVFFWNESDMFDVWAAAPAAAFERRAQVFRAVIETVAYLPHPRAPEPAPPAALVPLATAYSRYSGSLRKDAQREERSVAGLPENVRRIRHSWETAWFEAVVRGDELLQVRRKIFFLPFAEAGINAQVMIGMDLKNATGADNLSADFQVWLRDALTAYMRGYSVDARREEGPLTVHVLREGQDFIVEYARVETQRALDARAETDR